jgi:hypothetical protein
MDKEILDKINNPAALDKLSVLIEDILNHDLIKEARELIAGLQGAMSRFPTLSKEAPDSFLVYNDALVKAKFVCLFDLPEKEILALLKEYIYAPLNYLTVYDLNRKLNYKLRDILDLEERDVFKEKIKNELLSCGYRLTGAKIQVGTSVLEPTVGNWVKDYYFKVGLEPVSSFKQSEYLLSGDNVKKIKPEQREKLKYLIDIIEKLKLSSTDSPEESFAALSPTGELNLVSRGRPEKIDPDIRRIYDRIVAKKAPKEGKGDMGADKKTTPKPVSPENKGGENNLETELKNYPPGSLEYKAVKQEIARAKKANAKK